MIMNDKSNSVPTYRRDSIVALRPPGEFVELTGLRSAGIDRKLGYFGSEPFVIFGYCPGASDVVWKDAHSIGFGGGWRFFLWDLAPAVRRFDADLGTLTDLGTHVLFMDRRRPAMYAAPRESAEAYLARLYGMPIPARACLCSHTSCALCPVKSCPHAGSAGRSQSCA